MGGLLTLLTISFLVYNSAKEIQRFYVNKTTTKMAILRNDLPQTIPLKLGMLVYNDCDNLHIDFTNQAKNTELEVEDLTYRFVQNGDACNISVATIIPSVPGSFHIGFGRNFNGSKGEHKHQTLGLRNHNLTHTIQYLHYGTKSSPSPIDNSTLQLIHRKPYQINYFLHLIPINHKTDFSFQLIADVVKTNIEKTRAGGFEGIVFDWCFSPLELQKINEKENGISLISHLLGLFGSFFVFVRVIDRVAYTLRH